MSFFTVPTIREWCRRYMIGKASPERIEEIIANDLQTLKKFREINGLTNDDDFQKMLDSPANNNKLMVPLAFSLNCFVKK